MAVADAAAAGRRATLVALRDRLADEVDRCDSARDLPALARQLAAVLEQIDSLPSGVEVSAADEIAQRRAARRSGTGRPSRAKRPG